MSEHTSADAEARRRARPENNFFGARLLASYPINERHRFVAEVRVARDGQHVIVISRWKDTPKGPRRLGSCIEFAAHRTPGIAGLVNDVLKALDAEHAAKAPGKAATK